MEKENQPDKIQYVIIPEFILSRTDMKPGEKLLFGDIASHTILKGYCWGTNEYFAERYGVSSRTISRWIGKLEKRKLIISTMIYQKDSKEVSERRIVINTADPVLLEYMSWYGQKCLPAIDRIVDTPIDTDVQDNNKNMNNKCLINLNVKNVFLNYEEYEKLVNEFGKEKVETGLQKYSSWKLQKNAHPKSDFESLTKWLKKAAEGKVVSFKPRMTAVKESGADVFSEKELEEISALF